MRSTVFGQVAVQLVMPALAALLAVAADHLARDERPLLRPMLRDEGPEPSILIGVPWLAIVLRVGVLVLPACMRERADERLGSTRTLHDVGAQGPGPRHPNAAGGEGGRGRCAPSGRHGTRETDTQLMIGVHACMHA